MQEVDFLSSGLGQTRHAEHMEPENPSKSGACHDSVYPSNDLKTGTGTYLTQDGPSANIQPTTGPSDRQLGLGEEEKHSVDFHKTEVSGLRVIPSSTISVGGDECVRDRSMKMHTEREPSLIQPSVKTEKSVFACGVPSHDRTSAIEYAKGPEGEEANAEIQSIMEQFNDETYESKEIMSTAMTDSSRVSILRSSVAINNALHPSRKSSLEPPQSGVAHAANAATLPGTGGMGQTYEKIGFAGSISKLGAAWNPKHSETDRLDTTRAASLKSSLSSPSLHKALPPAPEPDFDLPFDFHRFLDQLRHRTADPVAKFLRSFLLEFGKKQWMVHEQVKIIRDFLTFINSKMAHCEVWRDVSDAEFDNAKEGMEKLVMNRLYSQTFSPAIPDPANLPSSKDKTKGAQRRMGPARRGQHQEDIERDGVLAQKMRIYKWVREEHLDIAPVDDSGKRFLVLAQQGSRKSPFGFNLAYITRITQNQILQSATR